jgi:hypothetical protein
MRPSLSADNRAALRCLIRSYADLLRPDELSALYEMHGHPALTVIDRLRLTVLARIALDRAAAEEVRHAA